MFFGTTNSENGYLRDITGNRRYWNIKLSGSSKYKPWQMTSELGQCWADAGAEARHSVMEESWAPSSSVTFVVRIVLRKSMRLQDSSDRDQVRCYLVPTPWGAD